MVTGGIESADKLGNDCGFGGMGVTGGWACVERC